MRVSIAVAASVIFARSVGEILFHASFVMIERADERRDVEVEHVLRVAEDLQHQREVRRLGAASIMPVPSFSCAGMSVGSSATGWKPFDAYHCTISSSPLLV